MVEDVTKALALLAICSYVLGLITVNVHLSRISLSDFGLLQARYVYTGILVIAYVLFCCLLVSFYFWWPAQTVPRLIRSGGYTLITLIPAGLAALFLGGSRKDFGNTSEQSTKIRIWITTKRIVLFYLAVITGFLSGVSVFLLWVIARNKPLDKHDMPGFVKPYFQKLVYPWDQSLRGVEKWPWFTFGSFIFLLLFLAFFLVFVKTFYPNISETLGGGKPRLAQLLIAPEALEGAKQLGIPISEEHSPMTETVSILFEGANTFALRLPDNRVVQVNKTMIAGADVRTKFVRN